jgi:chromosomal replication initiator protein
VTVTGLQSKSRTKQLAIPRQVAMYLIRDLLGTQLVEIGNAFGGRDHSTVIHSLEKVELMMRSDTEFTDRVVNLKTTLEKLRS